jgi:hypothetical protein
MLFSFVCFLAFATLSAAPTFLLTRMRLNSDLRRAGPKPTADALERRNRVLLLIFFGTVVVVAFFEAIVPNLSDAILNFQERSQNLPGWALLQVGSGRISWLLYVAMFMGIVVGLTLGTLWAIRKDPGLNGVRAVDVI